MRRPIRFSSTTSGAGTRSCAINWTRDLIADSTHRHARGLLIRVTQMLTKLVQRMQRSGQ